MGWKNIEKEVIRLTNVERTRRGIRSLNTNSKLHRAAKKHSKYMMRHRYLGHSGPKGNTPSDRARSEGYSRYVGENAFHYPHSRSRSDRRTAHLLVKGWMDSPGHRANILNREYADIGVAVVRRLPRGRTYYATQVFGMGESYGSQPSSGRRRRRRRRPRNRRIGKFLAFVALAIILVWIALVIFGDEKTRSGIGNRLGGIFSTLPEQDARGAQPLNSRSPTPSPRVVSPTAMPARPAESIVPVSPVPVSVGTPIPALTLKPIATGTRTISIAASPTQIPPPEIGPVGEKDMKSDLELLLEGVSEIGAPGVPGPLCVYGSRAFPVVVGAIDEARAPVAAAGRWGAGRVVALGHDGYFTRETLDTSDTGRLITNALHWASGEATSAPRIGIAGDSDLKGWLHRAGYAVTGVQLTWDSLEGVDVVALVMWNQGKREIETLSEFVADGGGLVTAATGWGWAQLHPDRDLISDYAGNRLLSRAGIRWADDWLDRTSSKGYVVKGLPPELTHAGTALHAIEAQAMGSRELHDPEIVQALESLTQTSRCLPEDDTLLAPRLRTLIRNYEGHWPSVERPVVSTDVSARLAATLYVIDQNRTPAESVRAHQSAAEFPGAVPPEAPRITRTLTIDTSVPRWHSTGLYAAPGEVVAVTVPTKVVGASGFHVRVGAHSDGIWQRDEWTRMPEISRRFRISEATTKVANAFGGLIYFEVPIDADMGDIDVEIDGAVAAPLFVLGETDPEVWRNEIRHSPAPWAEIAGRNMIITTPSSETRDLDDPAAVAKIWDRVLDLNTQLAAWPSPVRSSPERFVVDRQISVGYMHSGYPIMAHMDQQANMVDADFLRSDCAWGFYHEVGHNHQSDDWTFNGTVEVTVNLFTLYVYEFLCGIPVAENYRGSAEFRTEQMALYDFDAPDFEQWKREPFIALVMYEQMQQAFGWEAYREVFSTYRALPDHERPRSDDEKRDQWMVRFSRQVGRNLGPFFETWGVPTSRAARDSIAELPVWMPPGFPPGR